MILDTNALSALAGRDAQLIELVRFAPRLYVTLISLGEFQYGITRAKGHVALQRWLDVFLGRAVVLFPDMETLTHYAAIRTELRDAGTPIPANDVWIAALARQHRLPLVTLDRHFTYVLDLKVSTW